mmetsp:Transcript_51478/g.135897  ORF Transcript_51478/g.135897 Transcript_51478/m.135897 type:complete len:327 (-) Transcript_51478:926-1906(-)
MKGRTWAARSSAVQSIPRPPPVATPVSIAEIAQAAVTCSVTPRMFSTRGKSFPMATSVSLTHSESRLAAAISISSFTRVAPDSVAPIAIPGKTNALLHWFAYVSPPAGVSVSWNGDPEAKIPRPSVHWTTASMVHSALEVGLDRGITRGCSVWVATSWRTSSVNRPPTVLQPKRMWGLQSFTLSISPSPSSASVANSASAPIFRRFFPISPFTSMTKKFPFATSSDTPVSRAIYFAVSSRIPSAADPAPAQRMRRSRSGTPEARTYPRKAARVTAAVPWMSSLNTKELCRYRRRSSRARSVSKSSKWIRAYGYLRRMAWINSSTYA